MALFGIGRNVCFPWYLGTAERIANLLCRTANHCCDPFFPPTASRHSLCKNQGAERDIPVGLSRSLLSSSGCAWAYPQALKQDIMKSKRDVSISKIPVQSSLSSKKHFSPWKLKQFTTVLVGGDCIGSIQGLPLTSCADKLTIGKWGGNMYLHSTYLFQDYL